MTPSGPILFCHCAYTETVLTSEAKRAAWSVLARAGMAVESVPDLCELAAKGDPLLGRIASARRPVVIACHERAVRWLFAAAGAPLPERAVIHDLRGKTDQSAARAVCGCVSVLGEHDGVTGEPLPTFPPKAPDQWVPWFPVIDYDRCKSCGQCVEFCLFGVYEGRSGRPRVVAPWKCKTNCPACARVCPHSAIIFPKYADGPISGDEGLLTEPGDLSADKMMLALRQRAAKARAAADARRAGERGKP